MNEKKASACVLAAGTLWGLISIFVRALTAVGFTSPEICGVRMSIGAIGMLLFLLFSDSGKLKIALRDLWMFIGTGIIGVVMFNICYFMAIQRSEASIAFILLYVSPVFVMLMSALFFKERITVKKLFALGMTLSGCILVAGFLGGAIRIQADVFLLGIGSGFFYATYSIFCRFALQKYDTMTVTFYTFLLGAIASIPISTPLHAVNLILQQPTCLLWCIGIGVLCTIVPYLFYTNGLKHMETGKAAILATVEPLVGALLGIFAYRESAGFGKILGMLLIFSAVILLNIKEKQVIEKQ